MDKFRILFFAAVVMIFTGCNDQPDYELSGHWIGYKATRVMGEDTVKENFHLIMNIRGDSMFVRNFKYIRWGERDSLSKYSYRVSNDSMISYYKEDSYKVRIVESTKEELVLSPGQSNLYYRRLYDKIPGETAADLAGNTYTISRFGRIIDTARFWDNNVVEMYNAQLGRRNQAFQYAQKIYAGHLFLVIDSPELPVFMVREARDGTFELKKEPRDTAGFVMRKNMISL